MTIGISLVIIGSLSLYIFFKAHGYQAYSRLSAKIPLVTQKSELKLLQGTTYFDNILPPKVAYIDSLNHFPLYEKVAIDQQADFTYLGKTPYDYYFNIYNFTRAPFHLIMFSFRTLWQSPLEKLMFID